MRAIIQSMLLGTLPWLVPPVGAMSFVPPASLADLAAESEAVCMAVAGGAAPRQRGSLLFTETEFIVAEAVRGELAPGDHVAVRTPGGEFGGRAWHVAGSPRFREGGAYFLCLRRVEDGAWVPALLSYGLLEETASSDGKLVLAPCAEAAEAQPLPRPDGVQPERIGRYRKDALLRHLEDVFSGREVWQSAAVETGEALAGAKGSPGECAYFTSAGRKFRWNVFDGGGSAEIYASIEGDASVAGGGFVELVQALDIWHSIQGTSLNLEFGGGLLSQLRCTTDDDIEAGMVLFNDPCGDIPDLNQCTGILAYGGPFASGTHRFDGEYWVTIMSWAVVVNNGTGCIGSTAYARMLAHELGHGLGYDHFADQAALMYEYCCNAPNETDTVCTQYTYPPRVAGNQRPEVDAGPSARLVLAKDTAFLTGVATDDGVPASPGALAYQWRMLAGPAAVTFSNARVAAPSVRFPASGTYLLALQVTDGELVRTDTVTLDVEIDAVRTRTMYFQNGTAGYAETRDTYIRENAPTAGAAAVGELRVDNDDPTGSSRLTQALIAFADVFGVELWQVAPGSRIVSARLELTESNAGDPVSLHRMLVPWAEDAVWNDFGADGIVAGSECLLAPDSSPASAAGIATFDVTASLAAWAADPCAVLGWALLPTGADAWGAYSSESVAPPRLAVTYEVAAPQTLIAKGDEWRYLKGRSDPPSDWNTLEFVPGASWLTGATGIGYGDDDDATELTDMQNSYLTFYCRREFRVAHASQIQPLRLSVDYDDGFVAYLNGVEVARSPSMGVAGAPVTRLTAAASHEAGTPQTFFLGTAALREGTNVLAVEVHNERTTSSDCSFIPELTAEFALIAPGATWRFMRGSAAPPAAWNQPEFDDGLWEEGPAAIGYGDGDDATVLADMRGGYLAVFCRKTFELADPGKFEELDFTAIYDDGLVVYLNGVEVGRANMPAGAADAGTRASSAIDMQTAFVRISPALLRAGTNVLAVSIHNASLTSGDLTFSPALFVVKAAQPVRCGPPPEFLRGDANDDGKLDIADAVRVLGYLFQHAAAPACADAFDVNDDGRIDVSDAVGTLLHLFVGRALPPPGMTCGEDPTTDALGECAASVCAPAP